MDRVEAEKHRKQESKPLAASTAHSWLAAVHSARAGAGASLGDQVSVDTPRKTPPAPLKLNMAQQRDKI